ncbi:MAG: DUF3566 domain-containing protein [Ilumatobacteraceae bacterium]
MAGEGADDGRSRASRVRPGVARRPERTTPVTAAEDDEAGPPTAEFELPTIVPANPSGQVPTVAAPPAPDPEPTSEPVPEPAMAPAESPVMQPTPDRRVVVRRPPRRPRVRRVSRVVRHIDPWSAFKVGALFSLVGYLVVLTAGVLLWRVADSTGTLANVERWFMQFGWETFEFRGDEIFDAAWRIGLFLAGGHTGVIVLLVTVFNLVSDIVGGVRVSVLEEEVVERSPDRPERARRTRSG